MIPAVARLGMTRASRAQRRGRHGITPLALEECEQVVGHRLGPVGAEQEPGIERLQQLRRGADARADHGRPARQRFHGDEAEALQLTRGQHEGVGDLVVARQVVLGDEAQERDVLVETTRPRLALECLAQRAGAADQQVHVGPAPRDDRHRAQQRVESHARLEVAHGQQERPVQRQAELGAQPPAVGGGAEAREIGAARNLHDALGRDPVELPEQRGREVAEDVDARRALQARALDGPERDHAGHAGEPAQVMRGHAPARAVLERRRRVERIQRRPAAAERRGEDTVARQRLVHVQDVGLGQQRRRAAPGLRHRAAQEAGR